MKSDNDVVDFIQTSTLSVHISEDKKRQIMSNIDQKMQSERTPHRHKNRFGWLGSSLAGVAALLIVIGGFSLEHHKSLTEHTTQNVTTADQHANSLSKLGASDVKAMKAIMKSEDGAVFEGLFPMHSGIAACQIPHGGPPPVNGSSATLPGTCQTQAQPQGANTKITMTEAWNNGRAHHRWTYLVNADGRIISHSQSGDTAPQFWK